MNDKLSLFQQVVNYFSPLMVSVGFGIGSWLWKIQKNQIKKNLFDLFSELTFAILAGQLIYQMCLYMNFDNHLTYIFVATASWGGGKTLDMLNDYLIRSLARKFNIKELEGNDEPPQIEQDVPVQQQDSNSNQN